MNDFSTEKLQKLNENKINEYRHAKLLSKTTCPLQCNLVDKSTSLSYRKRKKKMKKRAIIIGMVESAEKLRGALASHKRVQCKPVAKYQRAALGVYIYTLHVRVLLYMRSVLAVYSRDEGAKR